jgi:putative membrane protein insertion efficiency factor
MNFLKHMIVLPFIFVIQLYKIFISPILPPSCRYSPSCSTYAIDALKKHGLVKGVFLAVKRIGSCHPWGGRGFDPVP